MAGVVHISEEEAARDFAAVMQHIRSGDEVRLDCKDGVTAVVKRAEPVRQPPTSQKRTVAEPIESLRLCEEKEGRAVPDPDKASDMEDIHALYSRPTAVSQSRTKGRTAAEILNRLDDWESVHGVLVIDEGFADDVEAAHERMNRPMDSTKWDRYWIQIC